MLSVRACVRWSRSRCFLLRLSWLCVHVWVGSLGPEAPACFHDKQGGPSSQLFGTLRAVSTDFFYFILFLLGSGTCRCLRMYQVVYVGRASRRWMSRKESGPCFVHACYTWMLFFSVCWFWFGSVLLLLGWLAKQTDGRGVSFNIILIFPSTGMFLMCVLCWLFF